MEVNKLIELNEKIIEKALPKVEKALLSNIWDCECMESMTMAIDNLKDLHKIKGYHSDSKNLKEVKPVKDESEFMKEVGYILEARGEEEGVKCVMMVMSELMQDLSMLHTRLYEQVMMKMRDLK